MTDGPASYQDRIPGHVADDAVVRLRLTGSLSKFSVQDHPEVQSAWQMVKVKEHGFSLGVAASSHVVDPRYVVALELIVFPYCCVWRFTLHLQFGVPDLFEQCE